MSIEPIDLQRVALSASGANMPDPVRRSGLRYAAVDHPAWTLHAGEVVHLADGLVAAGGLPTPYGMRSPGVGVRVGRPKRAAGSR